MADLRSDEFMNHALRDWEDMVYRPRQARRASPPTQAMCARNVYQPAEGRNLFQDDEHLKAWLIRVTINRCNQLRRTASRHRTQPLPDDETRLPKTPPASAALMANEVWRVLDTLPPKYRAVVHLHYVEGYSTEEIAEIAKCRPSTVRSRLRRARAQLKTLIEQEESHEAVADGRVSCFDGGNREPEYGALRAFFPRSNTRVARSVGRVAHRTRAERAFARYGRGSARRCNGASFGGAGGGRLLRGRALAVGGARAFSGQLAGAGR
ncbi:MAG: RNA polymerase sigma factor [Eggerthellaceae bacterium]